MRFSVTKTPSYVVNASHYENFNFFCFLSILMVCVVLSVAICVNRLKKPEFRFSNANVFESININYLLLQTHF